MCPLQVKTPDNFQTLKIFLVHQNLNISQMFQVTEWRSGVSSSRGDDDQGVVQTVLHQDHGQPQRAQEPRGPGQLQSHVKDFPVCLRQEYASPGQSSRFLNHWIIYPTNNIICSKSHSDEHILSNSDCIYQILSLMLLEKKPEIPFMYWPINIIITMFRVAGLQMSWSFIFSLE